MYSNHDYEEILSTHTSWLQKAIVSIYSLIILLLMHEEITEADQNNLSEDFAHMLLHVKKKKNYFPALQSARSGGWVQKEIFRTR